MTIRQMVLTQAGFTVLTAVTAAEALALLRTAGGETVQAVVTDHLMPKMDGAEFVRELRKTRPSLPILVVSGLPDAHLAYEGLNVDFRQKPCAPEELIAALRNLTSRAA